MTSPAAQQNGNGRLTALAEKSAMLAEKTYTSAKGFVPEPARAKFEETEQRVAQAAAPYVNKAQDTGAPGAAAVYVETVSVRRRHSGGGGSRSVKWGALRSVQLCAPSVALSPCAASSHKAVQEALQLARPTHAGANILRAADDRLDTAINTAQKVYADNSAYLQVRYRDAWIRRLAPPVADQPCAAVSPQAQLSRQADFHRANLESYRAAREAYLKKVEDAVEFVKHKGLTGAARAAADEVLARVQEAKAGVLAAPGFVLSKVTAGRSLHQAVSTAPCGACPPGGACGPSPRCPPTQVHEAVDRLLAFSPVHSALEAAKPTFNAVSRVPDAGCCTTTALRRAGWYEPCGRLIPPCSHPPSAQAQSQYLRVHDSVVASQQYKQVYSLANSFAARAQQTWLYNKAKENLLPYAKPVVDPGEQ